MRTNKGSVDEAGGACFHLGICLVVVYVLSQLRNNNPLFMTSGMGVNIWVVSFDTVAQSIPKYFLSVVEIE